VSANLGSGARVVGTVAAWVCGTCYFISWAEICPWWLCSEHMSKKRNPGRQDFTKTIWVSGGQNSVFFSTNCMCVVSSYFTSTARRWHVCDTHSHKQKSSTGLEPTSVLKGSSGDRRPPIMGKDYPRTRKTPSTTSKIPRRPHVSTSSHQIDLCGPVYSPKRVPGSPQRAPVIYREIFLPKCDNTVFCKLY